MQFQKFIKTNENWCPNFDGDLVLVKYTEIGATKNYPAFIRICVRGNDDVELERDYTLEERETAFEMYQLIGDYTSKQDLLNFGFISY